MQKTECLSADKAQSSYKGGMYMQVLVMYYSASGNTKKLAEAVAKGVRESGGVQWA